MIANGLMFVITLSSPALADAFIFVPALILARPWTLVTYMFLHADIGHILFNMLALFFFGPRLELELGGKRFLWLYFLSGGTGALLSYFIAPLSSIIGASGAVYGVMLGFAFCWPTELVHVWGIFPIQARWFVIVMTGISLLGGFGKTGGNIAHFAHLGGFLGSFLYMKWLQRFSQPREAMQHAETYEPKDSDIKRWADIRPEGMHAVNREEYERIMSKMNSSGAESLAPQERAFLDRFSQR